MGYVYKVEDPETGEFYIGSRTRKGVVAEEDEDYKGSWVRWEPEKPQRLEKTIISSSIDDPDYTLEREALHIEEVIRNPLNRNYHIPNKGFCKAGSSITEKQKQQISKAQRGSIPWNKNKKRSEFEGEKNPNWKGGKPNCKECGKEISYVSIYCDKCNGKLHSERQRGKKNHQAKKCRHIESGKEFDTQSEAATYFDMTIGAISYHCRELSKNQKFEFVDSQ